MSSNNSCKILSLNVRGIREATKRRGIFSYLKDEKASFYFLQETYSETTDENVWKMNEEERSYSLMGRATAFFRKAKLSERGTKRRVSYYLV